MDDANRDWLFTVRPIGVIRSPIESDKEDGWGEVVSSIHLDPAMFTNDALCGLDQFSHIEVIFVFDRVGPASIETGSRHPRERTDWPRVGIFAQRAKGRPNRLGLSCCRLLQVEGLRLTVQGLDVFDGTPVLDIKPHFPQFGPRPPVCVPPWTGELMQDYF